MTPEEIAKRLVDKWFDSDAYDLFGAAPTIRAELAQAIRDAYERAAQAAEIADDWESAGAAARIRVLKGETI